jgi:hypothetical protein
MKALIKAAAIFCPTGKAVLENTHSQALTTKHLLKQLQARLDQHLEQYYIPRTQVTQKIAAEPGGMPSHVSR